MLLRAMAVAKSGRSDSNRPRKSRGRGLRTNTGCITCRKRHLKCDEAKPSCQTCARNDKSCVYPEGVLELVSQAVTHSADDNRSNSNAPTEEAPTNVDDVVQTDPSRNEHLGMTANEPADNLHPAHEGQIDVQQNIQQNHESHYLTSPGEVHDASRPQTSHVDPQHDSSNINYTSPASVGTGSAADQPIGVATARWFGMLAGDADIPLDLNLNYPTPSQALNNTSTPDYYSVEGYRPELRGEGSNSGTIARNYDAVNQEFQQRVAEELLWQLAVPLTLKQDEEKMFHTFVTHISQWMDLFDPYRHFSSLVPRLALHNVGLLNAILALSYRHNSLGDQPAFAREDALQYYHETLQYVRRAMQYTSYHTSLELLATTLIISAYEMLDGSSRDWERHLQGVFWIQRSQVIHGDSGGLRAAVWWAWLCQDIWAAFRDKRKVFTFWKPQRTLAELAPVHLAARSVFILGRVMNYCAQVELEESSTSILSKIKTAKDLTMMLDEWQSLLTPEFLPLPHNSHVANSVFRPLWVYPPVYAVAVQVHHASRILVLLNRPSLGGINAGMKRQSLLDGHVETICGIALLLSDYASSTLTSQCLFIAGLCTHDRQRRGEILDLLARCRMRTGWPRIPLQDELGKYWQDS